MISKSCRVSVDRLEHNLLENDADLVPGRYPSLPYQWRISRSVTISLFNILKQDHSHYNNIQKRLRLEALASFVFALRLRLVR